MKEVLIKKGVLLILAFFFVSGLLAQTALNLINAGFEEGSTGWENVNTGSYEYFAPVDGKSYAKNEHGDTPVTQITDVTIEAGKTYTLKVWTRSLLSDNYLEDLFNPSGEWPSETNATTIAKVELFAGSASLASASQQVNPKALSGAPATTPADDGCNVWIDGNYRMAFTGDNTLFYQTLDQDPIHDAWSSYNDSDFPGGDMAYGQIITSQGLKAVYPTYYNEEESVSVISMSQVTGGNAPDYSWSNPVEVLGNFTDNDPWVLDAHLYQDDDDKLYMSWGGQPFYVTEMDPSTGMIKGNPSSIEFDDHPAGTHVAVANWNGDEWTDGNDWFEGPCIYKHGDYYYLLGSYGHLGINYTIRMGRGTSPTGPFYDKDGRDMNVFDEDDQEYGNSFLLGDDGNQVVPGHPHIWEENGWFYMGYDYRYKKSVEDVEYDYNGIRRIYFEDGWPTIWTPITVTFNADDYPSLIGQQIGIRVANDGTLGSILGIDHVSLQVKNKFPSNPNIMPLGASRVEGARPVYESFRYELWKNLIENGWSFDYIGTMTDPASYTNYSGQVFDKHHEGHGGYTSGQILANLDEWMSSAGIPDIVLFSSPGGNDALEGLPVDEAISNINGIIDVLQAVNPDVTIFIEQLAPGHSDIMTITELEAYIEKLQSEVLTIATQQTTNTSNVIAVDMYTGWSDVYLADDVHYNTTGAKVIADRYDAAMEAFYPRGSTSVVKKKDSPAISLIFPNPVRNELQIVGDEIIESYEVYNQTGCVMKLGKGNRIDVSELCPGLYLIVLNGEFREKLVKY